MNTDDPADIAPLSYGAALALGLLLILGLPRETKRPADAGPDKSPDLPGSTSTLRPRHTAAQLAGNQ